MWSEVGIESLLEPKAQNGASLQEAAVKYAEKGFHIFPVKRLAKVPLTKNGFHDATSDVSTVREWWRRWPDANIGCATGDASGFIVIDVDPRNGGVAPQGLHTRVALTGGGGEHYYFRYPESSSDVKWRKTLAQGIDIKADGGYVLLPPSVTHSQYIYRDQDAVLERMPDWLIEACLKPEPDVSKVVLGDSSWDETDTRPGSLFNRSANWDEILEPHGWTAVYRDGDEVFWRRPGKTEGISATTNYDKSNLLYVFSTSTEFEASTAYTPFSAYTLLEHGGDYSTAAGALGTSQLLATANMTENLGQSYEFIPALPPEHFISRFISYGAKQTDAPTEYLESSGLILLSLAAGRCRSSLAPYPGGLRNNLYVCLVGETTRTRKSTVQRLTMDIARDVTPGSVLPNRATTEAFINALSTRNNLPALWAPDEFGVSLAEMYHRDFMAGIEELLLSAYSGDDYTYERVSGSVTIRSPYLSVLGAATPESIGRSGPTANESGLLPRFAIVYPKGLPEPRAVQNAVDLRAERAGLVSELQQIMAWSNIHNQITFSDDALRVLNNGERGYATGSGSARLPTMLYKVSALISGAELQDVVSADSAMAAVTIVNRWKEGAQNLVPMLTRGTHDPSFDKQAEFALDIVRQRGGKTPRSLVADTLRIKAARLDEIEKALLDWGLIQIEMLLHAKIWVLRES